MKLLSKWFSKGLETSKITLKFPFIVFYLAASYVVKLYIAGITKKSKLYSAARWCSDFDPSLNPSGKSRSAPVATKLKRFSSVADLYVNLPCEVHETLIGIAI